MKEFVFTKKIPYFGEYDAAAAAALASKAGITPRALGYAPVARSLFSI